MAEFGLCLVLQFRDNALSQYLAKFHAPLIERINLPDGALGKNAVLVKGYQLAKDSRREPLGENRVRRAVAFEYTMGYEPIRRTLGLDLLGRLPKCQRLSLGEDVCQQNVVMPPERIERLNKSDEIARNQPGALVN